MALLTFYGLISVLILWLAFKLDRADAARIAATQPPVMQDAETSWDERVKGALVYPCVEIFGWFLIGLVCLGAAINIWLGVLVALCIAVLLFLIVRQILIRDVEALNYPSLNRRPIILSAEFRRPTG